MSLKLTKDEEKRVLKASEECGDAKKIFKTLWPKLFKEQVYCCSDFKILVEDEIVTSDEWDGEPSWEFEGRTRSLIDICPFCEKKPNKPIA